MSKNKYNLIILVLGLVFVLGGCLKKTEIKPVVVEVEKQDDKQVVEKTDENGKDGEIDTGDWLTYRNEELGFEFKYPKYYKDLITTDIDFSKDDEINKGQSLLIYSANGNIKFHFYSKDYIAYFDELIYRGGKNLGDLCKKNLQLTEKYQGVFMSIVGFCDNIKINNQDTIYDIQMIYLSECDLTISQFAYLNLNNYKYSGLVISSPLTKKLDNNYNCSGNNSQLEKEIKQNFEKIISKKQLDEITKKEIEEFKLIISTFKIRS